MSHFEKSSLTSQLGGAANLPEFRRLILSHVNYRFLMEILNEIECNADWAESIAGDSYEHDNGFSKIVLAGILGDEFEMRFHLWNGKVARPCNIHNHTRNYVSLVLYGSLVNQQFIQSPSGDVFFQHRVRTRGEEGGYEVKYVRESRLSLTNEQRLHSATCHSAEAGVLHRIVQSELQPVATLFFQGRRERLETDMFSDRRVPEGLHEVAEFSTSDLLRRIAGIRERLEG